MYTQEIKCPLCGTLTRVNVCDAEGKSITPCGAILTKKSFFYQEVRCHAQIVVITDKSGNVIEIRQKGFWG